VRHRRRGGSPVTSTTTTHAATTTTLAVTTTTTTLAPPEVCDNCVDDDGDGWTDYGDPACCAQTAAMQVKKVLTSSRVRPER